VQDIVFQLQYYRRNDFTEMMIHHIATIILIASSYGNHVRQIGACIMFLHDIADFPGAMTKMFVDTPYVSMCLIGYVSLLILWAWTRLYVFPAQIIKSVLYELPNWNVSVGSAFFLIVLFCLHVYWYTLFLSMGYSFLVTGETKDTQENVNTDSDRAAVPSKSSKKGSKKFA
jgi:ceramide synthetase